VSAVKYRLDGNVAVLEIDNPPVNATSISVREGLAEALKEAGADPAVAAVVLTGSHGLFWRARYQGNRSGLSNKFPMLRDLQAQMEGCQSHRPLQSREWRSWRLRDCVDLPLARGCKERQGGLPEVSSDFCRVQAARSALRVSQVRRQRSTRSLPAPRFPPAMPWRWVD